MPECPENLKRFRWKPGQTGNPNGRPKAIFSKAYRKFLTLQFPAGGEAGEEFDKVIADTIKKGATIAEVIALQMIGEAIQGKLGHAMEIADRVDGKPKQTQQLVGPDEGPLQNINIDLANLDSKELRSLAKMLAKAGFETVENQDGTKGETNGPEA